MRRPSVSNSQRFEHPAADDGDEGDDGTILSIGSNHIQGSLAKGLLVQFICCNYPSIKDDDMNRKPLITDSHTCMWCACPTLYMDGVDS